jgi:hypothetical protein
MIDRTLQRMKARNRVQVDTLTTTLDNSETGVALDIDHLSAQAHGSIIEIGTEQMFVMSYSAPTYTVVRGWNGSTAAAHTSGDLVYVNPRFPRSMVVQALEEEINSWPNDVGKITSTELAFSATATAVDSGLGASVDLRRFLGLKTEPENAYDQWRNLDFGHIRDADASDFTSGYGIQPAAPLGIATTCHLQALVGYDLTLIATESTNLNTTVGVTGHMEEALMYGVMMRMMSGEEINRTDERHAQQEQRNERVPPTYLTQTMAIYSELRDRAIVEEVRRINAEYPYRKSALS